MDEILSYIQGNKERYFAELKELLAIPSISTNPENGPDMQRCAQWMADQMRIIGLQNVKLFPTAGHPIVYGEWLGAPGQPTVLIYGHYDVQPVEPLELWTSPPFEATVRENRLYARGSADDKGQVFIHFKGIEAFLKIKGSLPVNLKLLIEGEEEIGSTNLGAFVEEQKDLLSADLVLISDSSMFGENTPSICYGLRGLSYMQVDVVGPNKDLHSGSFGGAVHNPIQALAEIVSRLHDRNGRVTIPRFYDDVRPLTRREREAFKKLPWSDRKFAGELGVRQLYGEKGFTTLERLWARPTLECNGIWGGFTGEGAKTVLPSKASAKISMRLVPDQSSTKVARLFERHIKKLAPKSVQTKTTLLHGGEPAITPIDSPGVTAAVAALRKGFGKTPLYQREGGSIPIVVQFKEMLGIDTVLLGFGQPDENAHAPNEFFNLDHFFGGIRTIVHFFNELPGHMHGPRKKR
ncbi:MAG: Acetylornithine deacetylase-like protein [Bacteroidetes bacterium]|jgi:acetylornithine deacetylase/succinyl-diaminopimelate desuccinylase-like protein|nr:Acetylornithine deacetylase-like protein [Bacteroidota bacterium]